MKNRQRASKTELQQFVVNIVTQRPPTLLTEKKIKEYTRLQDDINSGRLTTLEGIRRRVRRFGL